MSNFEYIVSSLPVLLKDSASYQELDADAVIGDIRELCSQSDCGAVDLLLSGFDPEKLTAELYDEAFRSKSPFIRAFFDFDLNVRNAKAAFLNRAFGRPAEQDTIAVEGSSPMDPDEERSLGELLGTDDILKRERGIDGIYWDKIDDITVFDYFNLDAVLGFIAKLKITDRWLKLDEETGREMFRSLVSQVRSTFKGVEYSA